MTYVHKYLLIPLYSLESVSLLFHFRQGKDVTFAHSDSHFKRTKPESVHRLEVCLSCVSQ